MEVLLEKGVGDLLVVSPLLSTKTKSQVCQPTLTSDSKLMFSSPPWGF